MPETGQYIKCYYFGKIICIFACVYAYMDLVHTPRYCIWNLHAYLLLLLLLRVWSNFNKLKTPDHVLHVHFYRQNVKKIFIQFSTTICDGYIKGKVLSAMKIHGK